MSENQEAKRLFNETWDLMDREERTKEEDILMLHKAHTSCYLWRAAENPVNNTRGEWQVSRVYTLLSMGSPALLHANYSLEICLNQNIGGFDLAFGYEAVARAYSLMADWDKALEYKNLAIHACENIEKDEDKEYAFAEISNISIPTV